MRGMKDFVNCKALHISTGHGCYCIQYFMRCPTKGRYSPGIKAKEMRPCLVSFELAQSKELPELYRFSYWLTITWSEELKLKVKLCLTKQGTTWAPQSSPHWYFPIFLPIVRKLLEQSVGRASLPPPWSASSWGPGAMPFMVVSAQVASRMTHLLAY